MHIDRYYLYFSDFTITLTIVLEDVNRIRFS